MAVDPNKTLPNGMTLLTVKQLADELHKELLAEGKSIKDANSEAESLAETYGATMAVLNSIPDTSVSLTTVTPPSKSSTSKSSTVSKSTPSSGNGESSEYEAEVKAHEAANKADTVTGVGTTVHEGSTGLS